MRHHIEAPLELTSKMGEAIVDSTEEVKSTSEMDVAVAISTEEVEIQLEAVKHGPKVSECHSDRASQSH